MRTVWLICGMVAMGLGGLGIFLPLLPTVPFMLLAAFCFARSSESLHHWLVTHPTFGPPIDDWRRSGAIGRRAKWLASLSMAAAFGLSLAFGFGAKVLFVQLVTLGAVAVFIWTRPEA